MILITVQSYPSRVEAEIGKGLLEANDIKALVVADDAGGVYPLTMSTMGVQLQVERKNIKKTKDLLQVEK